VIELIVARLAGRILDDDDAFESSRLELLRDLECRGTDDEGRVCDESTLGA
jgi:hypothetical protein